MNFNPGDHIVCIQTLTHPPIKEYEKNYIYLVTAIGTDDLSFYLENDNNIHVNDFVAPDYFRLATEIEVFIYSVLKKPYDVTSYDRFNIEASLDERNRLTIVEELRKELEIGGIKPGEWIEPIKSEDIYTVTIDPKFDLSKLIITLKP